MAQHRCDHWDCDGTKLGHELARNFPEEIQTFTEAVERLIDTEHTFTVDPANLQVEPAHGWGCGDCSEEFSLGLDCSLCEAPRPPLLCPECDNGKPINCTGWAFDDADQLVPCEGGADRG